MKSDRAGTADSTLEERREIVRRFLSKELERFRSDVEEQDDTVLVSDYPVTWELREYITDALEGLMSTVMATRSDDSGI
jgi:hypothetical protein